MGYLTFKQMFMGVKNTLGADPIIKAAVALHEMKEQPQDLPHLETYLFDWETSDQSTTDRRTFGGGVAKPTRQTLVTINNDVYVRQRSHIGEDLGKTIEVVDALTAILEAQDKQPYFGLDGVKAFRWRGQHMNFRYGEGESAVGYVGTRIILTLTLF